MILNMTVDVGTANESHAFLRISGGGKVKAETVMRADQLDALIYQLGKIREALMPPVPRDLPQGRAEIMTVQDPVWRGGRTPAAPGKLLLLRHPGFGHLSFLFPDNEAARVAQHLSSLIMPTTQTLPRRQ